MNTALLQKVEESYTKKDKTEFKVGDKIAVHFKIKEGEKERIQVFEGFVLYFKGSGGIRETFCVRKISHGVGVEKIFPLHSPLIEKVEVQQKGKVRKAKIYYMRKRIGRASTKIAKGTDNKD